MNKHSFKKLKAVMLALPLMLSGVISPSPAQAVEADGYYRGHFKNDRGFNSGIVDIFVQTITVAGQPTRYGLILSRKNNQAAVFSIRENKDGTEAWSKLIAKATGITSVLGDAIYDVSYAKEGFGHTLTLTPTEYAAAHGCKFELVTHPRSRREWQSLPVNMETYKACGRQKVRLNNATLLGRFNLNAAIKNQTFGINPIIEDKTNKETFLSSIRSQSLNQDSESGRALDRKITAVIAVIKHKWVPFGKRLKIMQILQNGCLDPTTTLNEKW